MERNDAERATQSVWAGQSLRALKKDDRRARETLRNVASISLGGLLGRGTRLKACTYNEFNQIYQESVELVLGYWTREMQLEFSAAHCYGWHPDGFDFGRYLRASSPRYYRAYASLCELAQGRICL